MKSIFGFFASTFSKFTHGSKAKMKKMIFDSDKLGLIVFQRMASGFFWDERLFLQQVIGVCITLRIRIALKGGATAFNALQYAELITGSNDKQKIQR